MGNEENLRPIQPGERRAAKPKSEHRSKVVAVRVTGEELAALTKQAKEDGLSLSKWSRLKMGLEK